MLFFCWGVLELLVFDKIFIALLRLHFVTGSDQPKLGVNFV